MGEPCGGPGHSGDGANGAIAVMRQGSWYLRQSCTLHLPRPNLLGDEFGASPKKSTEMIFLVVD